MKKIVISRCGEFGLSKEAYDYMGLPYVEAYGCWFPKENKPVKRDNIKLIECVENLGDKANGRFAKLEIVEIPEEVNYQITICDGREAVAIWK